MCIRANLCRFNKTKCNNYSTKLAKAGRYFCKPHFKATPWNVVCTRIFLPPSYWKIWNFIKDFIFYGVWKSFLKVLQTLRKLFLLDVSLKETKNLFSYNINKQQRSKIVVDANLPDEVFVKISFFWFCRKTYVDAKWKNFGLVRIHVDKVKKTNENTSRFGMHTIKKQKISFKKKSFVHVFYKNHAHLFLTFFF